MKCENLDSNITDCPCSYDPCSRKGYCCRCIQYHLKNNELPACCFTPAEERTYNRSISYFVKRRSN